MKSRLIFTSQKKCCLKRCLAIVAKAHKMLSNSRLCYWHSKFDAIIWFSILEVESLVDISLIRDFRRLKSFDWMRIENLIRKALAIMTLSVLKEMSDAIFRVHYSLLSNIYNHTHRQLTRKLASIIIIWTNISNAFSAFWPSIFVDSRLTNACFGQQTN